ncbi:MAG: hypothetical protein COV30_01535 [Candidatus Yanofskybacteria bacterium CG10_big_fil_rev_8_21_14_0_10_37_15]|uniref:Uncharacterized protein n=1 Tax=Candidatus Yanofskybacteria bacterium CG10_big_fil_rev_8_21_14_0_10_37_15 TaxID=1975097 RepID=A0A2H0R738_9BACT|nr:MAG: hypothetical protein COV30_01535 [Candidatus Yanofskybacteria bacterium CG10_big_fil_rev_8_21_14_0_10_37_15]
MKSKKQDEGFHREVELYRDGSGSRVVILPGPTETPEVWLGKMKRVAKFNYGNDLKKLRGALALALKDMKKRRSS